MERRLAAIMAADMVGYSRLMAADEDGTIARHKSHRKELIDPRVASHNGRIVKATGDGLLAEFPSVSGAVECAVEIQRGVAGREAAEPKERRIEYRIGINLGDIVVDDDDVFGDGVNLAARLEGLAEPGGICVSGKVREELRKRLDLIFAPMGQQRVKNRAEPVEAWRVVLDGSAVTRASRALRGPGRFRAAVVAALALLLLAVVGAGGWWWQRSEAAGPPLPDEPSVAVLPFDNLSGDERLGRLADGMVTDIITDLSASRLLTVIAPGTSFAYRDGPRDARRIGRELGVRYLVDGTLQGDGQRLRASVQLVEAATGAQLWSERYDRPVEDLFAVQDELTQRIANALRGGTIDAARDVARSTPPEDLRAYDLLLLAIEQRWLWTKEANAKALDLVRQALDLDPRFAAAHVELAYLYRQQVDAGFAVSIDVAMAHWLEAATKAVGFDPTYARARVALGVWYVYAGKADLAAPELEQALALAPGNAEILATVAEQMPFLGQSARAVELIEQAVRLDPTSFYKDVQWQTYFFARRFDDAAAAVESTPELNRWPQLFAAMSYAQLGKSADLERWRTRFLESWPDYSHELGVSEGVAFGSAAEAEQRLWFESHVKAGIPTCATAEQVAELQIKRLPDCDAERARLAAPKI